MIYDLPVVDEKVKPHQVTTLHMICALAFIVSGIITIRYSYEIVPWGVAMLVIGVLLTVLVMAKNKWVISNPVNLMFRIIELLIVLGIEAYSVFMQYKFPMVIFAVLGAAILFGIFSERDSGTPLSVHLDEQGIKLPPTARKRFKPWTEVEEVILRFGIITINCTDNSLFQWTIAGTPMDKEIFEAWCAAQVEGNRSKRRNDDW